MEPANTKFNANGIAMTYDPSKVSLTDIDPVSKLPYLHESFVLHTFVPIRYVRRQKPFDDANFVGLYPEGYRIPTILTKDSKFNVVKKTTFDDAVVCFMVGTETVGQDENKTPTIDCVTNHQYTRPGYLNLNAKGAARQSKSAPAISRERTKTMLQSAVSTRGTTSKTYLKNQNKQQEESEIAEDNEPLTPRTFSATPAPKAKRKKLPDNIEYALALKHPEWPEVAAEWESRARNCGWPGKRVEKKIVSGGCHVTPGAHPKSEDPDLEWEYTFFEAERVMDKEAVSSVQRQCFIVFCLLCADCLDKKSVSLRQLKSVFYFMCETTDPQIWRSNKAVCVNALLDSLLDCVRSGNLPDYFIPKNNTLSHVDKEKMVELESDISKIRNNPADALLEKTETCAFVNIFPFYCKVRDLFKPFMADAEEFVKKKDIEQSARALCTVTDELCNSFYLDQGFQAFEDMFEEIGIYVSSLIAHGVSGFEETIEYFIKPLQGDAEASKHLQALPEILSQKNIALSETLPTSEIWRPIRMCRLLIQKFANDKTGSHLFDHLGCMYHSASKSNDEQRQDALQRADAAFKEALGKEDCGIGTYVDYGRFLCRTKRFEDSIPLLRKVILKENKKPESINYYGKMESLVSDEFMKKEITSSDGFEIFSVSFSYYLMCECYIKLKKKQDFLKTMKQFEELCAEIQDANSYSLLGYTAMKVHQFKKAHAHFKKVQELQPDNNLVLENTKSCSKYDSKNVSDESLDLSKTMEKLKF
ncbi:uncharacterized protein LOC127856073 isoform X1 [Dreissena polymorpha]|uniref:uncharacterized protein LOC127856073 isoform X1 n=1 Tax=Dreissena polymorpha TaxID=45954 RepID=UPI0022656101|nr:uncharacterized protein LOC127856073 isoform X1 [Dreissena polymorpha]